MDLTVTPDGNGWYFDKWEGPEGSEIADGDDTDYNILMDDDKEIEAISVIQNIQ